MYLQTPQTHDERFRQEHDLFVIMNYKQKRAILKKEARDEWERKNGIKSGLQEEARRKESVSIF